MAFDSYITWLTTEPIKEIKEWWENFKTAFPQTAAFIESRIFAPFVTAWDNTIGFLEEQSGRVNTWWEQFKLDHPKVGTWMQDNIVTPITDNWGTVIGEIILQLAKLIPGIGPIISFITAAASLEEAWKDIGPFFTDVVQLTSRTHGQA